jgi:hypothetical protein
MMVALEEKIMVNKIPVWKEALREMRTSVQQVRNSPAGGRSSFSSLEDLWQEAYANKQL